jgi:hypothetical protein
VPATAGIALWTVSAWALRRRPPVLAAFTLGSGAILTFLMLLWHGELRHHGQIWVLFVAALWLVRIGSPTAPLPRWIGAILLVQVLAAGQALIADIRHPFSRAQDTARFLSDPRWREVPIVGSIDYAVQAVAVYSY